MEVKHLQGFVLLLVLIGMLLGVGVLTLDKYQRAVRTTTTVTDSGNNFSTGTSVDFAQTYCLAITQVDNTTDTFDLDVYNFTFTDADACTVGYDAVPACASPLCNITYTYGAATASATSAINTNAAITPIASTWLPLIVTVAVLAVILGLVISSFAGKRR